jgi:small-conductance mechanosensitive channel
MVWQWLSVGALLVGATVLAFALQWLVLAVGGRLAGRSRVAWDNQLVVSLKGPLALLMWALVVHAGSGPIGLPDGRLGETRDLLVRSITIISLVWFAQRLLQVIVLYVTSREQQPGGRYRSLRTQFEFTRRFLEFGIWFVGSSVFLLQFSVVRNVGVSLLASAGVAGVVLGIAAQKSFASLFAGIQLSITQPIRLGDVVVIEGQFGTIDEIRLTYVVVRTWDNRRLIVPIAFFLDKIFENWSLAGSAMLSTVVLKVDYLADVDAFRKEIDVLLSDPRVKAMWDGKTRTVHVTEADDRTMTLRLLVGAEDPNVAFELRCLIREGLIRFLRRHPEWLPRGRSEALPNEPEQLNSPAPGAVNSPEV